MTGDLGPGAPTPTEPRGGSEGTPASKGTAATAPVGDPERGWRRILRRPSTAVAIGGLFVLVGLLLPSTEADGFLDPRSHEREGAAALLELGSIHRQVDIALEPQSGSSTALVLVDRLTHEQHETLRNWVFSGGWLVVADPASALSALPTPGINRGAFGVPITVDADCDPMGERVVDTAVSATTWALFATTGAAAACYPFEDGAGLVVFRAGEGRVLSFGAASILTNRSIGAPGHGTLAAALAAWGPEGDLTVLEAAPPEPGDASPIDLVPARAWQAAGLLALAMALAMLATGRRHGLPVHERIPVLARGSDLTTSVGGLLARAGDRDHAANQLRATARRAVEERLAGILDDPPEPGQIARLASLLSLPASQVQTAIVDTPVVTDDQLVAVARAAAAVHRRLAAGRRPNPDS